MKRSNTLRTLAIALAIATISTTTAFASAKGTETVLSDSEWNTIEENSRWERALQPAESILLVSSVQNTLDMDLMAGRKTTLSLNAPFSANEQVGLVVIAADGDVVYTATGNYGELQTFTINPNFRWDETYVVRLYSTHEIFETKVQVIFL